MNDLFTYIRPEHLQNSKRDWIVNGILSAIEDNALPKGASLPSVNKFIQRLGVARMTVVNSLNILKERGIIVSEDKVGYFVRDVNVKRELKVLLFLTGFYSYHEILYNNIIENINDQDITIDVYFHHCNPKIFKSILLENLGSYGLYVITGFDDPQVKSILSRVPPKKLLQIIRPPLLDNCSFIGQDFHNALKNSLEKLRGQLEKYEKFILIYSIKKGHPEGIEEAFTEFCINNKINYQIEKSVRRSLITKGCAFWVIEDIDLISLIKFGDEMGFRIGKELGILSYNETPMKEFIRNGITVISADFAKMGQSISMYIKNPRPTTEIFVPEVIIRNSL